MTKKIHPETNISAVILAGGQGSRMGGVDKGLVKLAQKPLISHVIAHIQPQVKNIIISANRNLLQYQSFGFTVVNDGDKDGNIEFAGPLAGILSALAVCQTHWLLTLPADSPFIPDNLARHLSHNMQNKKIAMVHDGSRLQPAFALLHKSLLPSLTSFLQHGERKTRLWMQQQPHSIVDFSRQANQFININTEAELQKAEERLK